MSSEIHNSSTILETADEKRERWRSIYILYFSTFLMGLGFSTVLTSVWPYLDKLDSNAGKEFMGFVVAAHPLGQMIFSPLIGWWSNKTKTVHLPLLLCVCVFSFANIGYSLLEVLSHSHRKYGMFITRFLTGISSSNMAICRSYLSAATTLHERTKSVSMIAFSQVLGFIVGPGLQAAFTPLGDQDYKHILNVIPLNMYTVAGWLNVGLGIINFVLFLPAVFKERKIAAKEAMLIQNVESEKAAWKGKKPDYFSAVTLIVAYFFLNFHFVLLETLATSLTMDQFGWSKQDSLFYIGILMVGGAIIACAAFIAISHLTKCFKESKVLIWGGFTFMAFGSLFLIPWGPHTPPIASAIDPESVSNSNSSLVTNETISLGCPPSQEWCSYTPALTLTQFIISYVLTSLGYPISLALIQTLTSKVLGPRPQGTWMGSMVGIGCLARVMGPVFISIIYTRFGTIWTFSFTTLLQIIIIVWLISTDKRINYVIDLHAERVLEKDNKEIEMQNLADKNIENF